MARAGKATIREKAATRRTSRAPEKSGKELQFEASATQGQPPPSFGVGAAPEEGRYVAEIKRTEKKLSVTDELLHFLKRDSEEELIFQSFELLGDYIAKNIEDSFSRASALRKLLESKEAVKRAISLKRAPTWVVKFHHPEEQTKQNKKK